MKCTLAGFLCNRKPSNEYQFLTFYLMNEDFMTRGTFKQRKGLPLGSRDYPSEPLSTVSMRALRLSFTNFVSFSYLMK